MFELKKRSNPKIDAGLELISALGTTELKNIELRDLLHKLISKNWNIIDEIIKTAQENDLLQKTKDFWAIRPEESTLQFEKPKIIKQEETTSCKHCGRKITTAFYVELVSHTYGPFGSKCVRKIHLGYLLQ